MGFLQQALMELLLRLNSQLECQAAITMCKLIYLHNDTIQYGAFISQQQPNKKEEK